MIIKIVKFEKKVTNDWCCSMVPKMAFLAISKHPHKDYLVST